jgi:hypothetical protein
VIFFLPNGGITVKFNGHEFNHVDDVTH